MAYTLEFNLISNIFCSEIKYRRSKVEAPQSTSVLETAEKAHYCQHTKAKAIHPLKALGLWFMCVMFHEAVIILEVTGGHFIQ